MFIGGCILNLLFVLHTNFWTPDVRWGVYATASGQVGIKEETGNNDGKEIDKYQAVTGAKKGSPYCASFVAWCFEQHGIQNPRSAWSPSYFARNIVYDSRYRNSNPVHLCDVFGIYFPDMGRIAHVGFIVKWGDGFVHTIEANTGSAQAGMATREGQGVYKKIRLKRQIYQVSNWIK